MNEFFNSKNKQLFTIKEILIVIILSSVAMSFIFDAKQFQAPIKMISDDPVVLDWRNLPLYGLKTMLRMLLAMFVSLIFALIYGNLAAKFKLIERILIAFLDLLQSIPILGYLSFTIAGFLALFPNKMFGIELAAIFAIFTSQAWNMAFSYYQSLKTIPNDLKEVSKIIGLSWFDRLFYMEIPFALPSMIWNCMISMSGGWFFVVASESITVGNASYTLHGIGSYISAGILDRNILAIVQAVIAMIVVILIYDNLLFRPLVAWSDKFRYENVINDQAPNSWFKNLIGDSFIIGVIRKFFIKIFSICSRLIYKMQKVSLIKIQDNSVKNIFSLIYDIWPYIFYLLFALGLSYGIWLIIAAIKDHTTLSEVMHVIVLTSKTMIRVVILIILASFIWVPVGVYIGLRPNLVGISQPIIQFLAAFPANLLFPVTVVVIQKYNLDPNIWLSLLMIIGTQWYILFNVIAGASAFPADLKEAANSFRIRGFMWWSKIILPAIFPYLVTGMIIASGAAWNASIVAEIVTWGNTTLTAEGIGCYITQATNAGDYTKITLGISVLSIFILLFNRIIWKPLYNYAYEKIKIE